VGVIPVLSPAAQACAAWFRKLSRALKVCRLYKTDNTVVVNGRDQVIEGLAKLVEECGGITFRFTPSEILLGDEAVVRPKAKADPDDAMGSGEEQLPFVFFRDGIRGLRIPLATPRAELEALFDALRAVGSGPATQDDLVTLLWQANLNHVQIESVPLEQSIYLTTRTGSGGGGDGAGPIYSRSPGGAEVHADIGQDAGAQGLHRDTFDDWEPADSHAEVPRAYAELLPKMDYARAHFRAAWDEEAARPWTVEAPQVLRQILALDPREETRRDLAHSVVSWLAAALQDAALTEAQLAAAVLKEFDPERTWADDDLAAALSAFDHSHLAEYLDESTQDEQAQFSALAVALGKCVVPLVCSVLKGASRVRTRAAACTALSYLCADDPRMLEPFLDDRREEVVLSIVFVLGQIGGPEVVDVLRLAAMHRDPRVRRQVIQALGSVPVEERVPLLLDQLGTDDPQILSSTLHMLSREKSPRVSRALVECIAKTNFENRSEEIQRALFNALADVADDEAVPALEVMLKKGGWLARRSFTRMAAARTLFRIGTPRAHAVLEDGQRSRNAAIRSACQDAFHARSAA
jgi:hypothetical protein